MAEELSAKMRLYLAEVYQLLDLEQPEDGYVSTSSLADVLHVSAPAVNRAINRLKEAGLLEHEPYQGIKLTPEGEAEALKQLRAQRIAEMFLADVMGFSWDEVPEEAAQISSALSMPIVNRMAEMCGEPQFNPHGDPIPQADGSIAVMDDHPLSQIEAGKHVSITRMRTRDPNRLQYIAALGLVPGTELEVIHVAPFDGPMQLKVNNEYRIIGHNLAELIRVQELDSETT
jgi:DtxR family Mn-dependent transcriptional regulator